MIDQSNSSLFKNLFEQAQTVLVVYPPDALRDHLFAATALYKTLQLQTNKKISLISSRDLSQDESDIVYLSDTKTDIGHKNLCISFDHTEQAVDKVSYHVDEVNKKFYLTIKPKDGQEPLSHETVEFSYVGAEADMIILIGVDNLNSLEQVYFGYENMYQSTALISINSYLTDFGNMKVDITGHSSVSEYVGALLQSLQLALDPESATNLLAGIDEETNRLTAFTTTPETFEMVARLLRGGARRFVRSGGIEQSSSFDSEEQMIEEESVVEQELPITQQVQQVRQVEQQQVLEIAETPEVVGAKMVSPIEPASPKQTKRARAQQAKKAQIVQEQSIGQTAQQSQQQEIGQGTSRS